MAHADETERSITPGRVEVSLSDGGSLLVWPAGSARRPHVQDDTPTTPLLELIPTLGLLVKRSRHVGSDTGIDGGSVRDEIRESGTADQEKGEARTLLLHAEIVSSAAPASSTYGTKRPRDVK